MTLTRFGLARVMALLICGMLSLNSAIATESGGSHYFPGAYNDFGMNLKLPPGLYFRDDLVYYGAKFSAGTTLGNFGVINLDEDLWTNLFKLAWVSDFKVLGANYSAVLVLPVIFDANLSGSVQFGPHRISNHGNRGGMGDLAVAPLSLTWKWGDVNVDLSQYIFMPTGYYDANNIINLGRNYWSFDTLLGMTWIDSTRGHEISFRAGFMSNTENDATQYQSGDEFHLDYMVAQHFSETFAIGVTGYYYTQLSDDRSPLLNKLAQLRSRIPGLPTVNGYRGEAAGIGPAVLYSPLLGGKRISFIGKWIHEFDVKNRFNGDIGMLSVALEF